ncbi:MAG: AAA family ATPase [Lachnospiraceae bacterium]|jgi:SpoVK/Ycf46/Vps4 family AAA+-type ATPase|nr:AAA family ATPase [Lachnospiraceae bacterium]
MDSFFGGMDSGGNKSIYTMEEIEKAEKMKKKNGGTLMENLVKLTGKTLPTASGVSARYSIPDITQELFSRSSNDKSGDANRAAKAQKDAVKAAPDASEKKWIDPTEQLLRNSESLNQELQNLKQSLKDDFGIEQTEDESWKKDFGISNSTSEAEDEQTPRISLESFNGLADEVAKKLFGQEEFIKKLVIALKRPLVMPPEQPKAQNTIFITGPKDTGKHLALSELARELHERKIIKSEKIKTMDLGIYTDGSMEKLFLQDIFAALSGKEELILFENFENCHPSFLAHISDLVTEGRFRLSERYVMQSGQLVSVANSLATNTVGELDASGKYLIFITEKSLDKTAGIMGAPFVDALGDICKTQALGDDTIRRIAESEREQLKEKASRRFSFELDFAEDFLDFSITKSQRQAGVKGIQDFYATVFSALAQAKLEGEYPDHMSLTLLVEEGKILAKGEAETIDLSAFMPKGYQGEVEEIKKELESIIGLKEVKEYVSGLEEYYKVQKRREEEGLTTGGLSKHMIFTGNPGTGKTTIARIVSKYLKAIGVLSGGQLVEVSRADLVGRYVGHTAPLTNKVISSAIGGVLFIDEAYSLYRGSEDSFGMEAIDTLVKGMEDNRENLIVILAGYSAEMEEFLTANSGLKSRFPNVIDFPDYTGEELLQIACSIAKSKGYVIEEGAMPGLKSYFNAVQMAGAKDAGNGRLARNKIEEAILNQSKRLVAQPEAELSTLLSEDFDLADLSGD